MESTPRIEAVITCTETSNIRKNFNGRYSILVNKKHEFSTNGRDSYFNLKKKKEVYDHVSTVHVRLPIL